MITSVNNWNSTIAATTAQNFTGPVINQAACAKVERYNALAREHGLTPVQLALAFCYRNWRVASTIIGVTSEAQLDECVAAWHTQLSPELAKAIDDLLHQRHSVMEVQSKHSVSIQRNGLHCGTAPRITLASRVRTRLDKAVANLERLVALLDVQYGRAEDTHGWMHRVF